MTEISTTRSGNVLVPYVDAKKRTKQVDNSVLATASATGGVTWTCNDAVGMAEADSLGNWWFNFAIRGAVSTGARASFTLGIAGIANSTTSQYTFSAYASLNPSYALVPCSGITGGDGNNQIVAAHNAGSVDTREYYFSGCIPLLAKPTWADAHMEDVAAVDVFIAENSLPGSKLLDNSIPVSKLVGSGSGPAGMVVAFPAATAPTGWAICDGSEKSKTTYASLFSAIGTTWDTCTNPLTGSAYSSPASGNFRLPDLRGTFLRGAGNFGDVSKDTVLGGFQSDATAPNNLSNSFSYVTGSVGGSDGTHAHSGTTITEGNVGGNGNITYWNPTNSGNWAGGGSAGAATGTHTHGWSTSGTGSHGHSVTGDQLVAAGQGISGDSETRPQNVGMNFIIKLFD